MSGKKKAVYTATMEFRDECALWYAYSKNKAPAENARRKLYRATQEAQGIKAEADRIENELRAIVGLDPLPEVMP